MLQTHLIMRYVTMSIAQVRNISFTSLFRGFYGRRFLALFYGKYVICCCCKIRLRLFCTKL